MLRKMANSICSMIQLEEDYASKHENKQLAILDLNLEVKLVKINDVTRPKLFYMYHGQLASDARRLRHVGLAKADGTDPIRFPYTKKYHRVLSTSMRLWLHRAL